MDDFSMEPLNNSAIGNIFIYILCFSDETLGSVLLNRSKGKNIERIFSHEFVLHLIYPFSVISRRTATEGNWSGSWCSDSNLPVSFVSKFSLTFFELLSEYAFFMDVWLNTLLFDKWIVLHKLGNTCSTQTYVCFKKKINNLVYIGKSKEKLHHCIFTFVQFEAMELAFRFYYDVGFMHF